MITVKKPVEQAAVLTGQFLKILDLEGYRFEFSNDPNIRICGVAEGELLFAIRCKVFKNKEKTEKSE